MTWHRITVPGRPVPQGSMTPYAKGKMVRGRWEPFKTRDGRLVLAVKASNEKRLKAWRKRVSTLAAVSPARPETVLAGPCQVELVFTFERPGVHYFQRVGGNVIRPDAPSWCDTITTGDLDKLTRAVFDALTDAGWWGDDAQACRLVAEARWADVDAVHINVATMDHVAPPVDQPALFP